VLRVKLRHLDAWTTARREAADRYRSLFASHGLEGRALAADRAAGHFHVYNQFVIRVPDEVRDPLRAHLTARKIGTEIYYPVPLHLQACFAALGHRPGDFPRAEAAARQTLALPIYPELTDEAQRLVVGAIADYFAQQGPEPEDVRGRRPRGRLRPGARRLRRRPGTPSGGAPRPRPSRDAARPSGRPEGAMIYN
jgi:dTDP-4-amino-4,6-dideoxygalactose transaminase